MTKGPLLQQFWDELPEERQKKIKARAEEIIQECRTLQELRTGVGMTQAELADRLGMAESNLSRLENGKDVKLSTLQNYVDALGGDIHITVSLPDRAPVSFDVVDFLDQPHEDKAFQEVHPV